MEKQQCRIRSIKAPKNVSSNFAISNIQNIIDALLNDVNQFLYEKDHSVYVVCKLVVKYLMKWEFFFTLTSLFLYVPASH